MTVPNVSTTHHDAINALFESLENIAQRNPPGAHHPDDSNIGGILKAADPGQISAGISAPVAAKCDDLRRKLSIHDAFTSFSGQMPVP